MISGSTPSGDMPQKPAEPVGNLAVLDRRRGGQRADANRFPRLRSLLERVEAARRRAEQEVQEKVERARSDALAGTAEEPEGAEGGDEEPAPDEEAPHRAPAEEPAGIRYVAGRRIRTF